MERASLHLLATLVLAAAVCLPAAAQDARRLLQPPALDPDALATLEARELRWQRRGDLVEATGDVSLKLGELTLRAPTLIADLEAGRAVAEGGVTVTAGSRRLLAERLRLDLVGGGAAAEQAELVSLDPRTGRALVRLSAARLSRTEAGRWLAEDVRFSACDCGPDRPPSWSLSAASAKVDPDRGAWLYWPTFRIADVPVLPLPAFYVPLGERRTGLLLPIGGYSGRNGLRLAEPLYLVLGRSHDLTVTVGGWAGREGSAGVRGFDQALEWRYAPALRTSGRAELVHLYDLTDEQGAPRGSRMAFHWSHASRFDDGGFGRAGAGLHAEVDLLGDAAWRTDLAPDLSGREVGYVRSTARLHAAPAEGLAAELAGGWLQDLRLPRVSVEGQSVTRPLFGAAPADRIGGPPITFQPLPTLHARLVPQPLVGGLAISGALHGVSWILPTASFDDAGEDGLLPGDLGFTGPDAGEADGLLGPGEQGPVLHAGAAAALSQAFHVGDALAGRVSAGVRLDGWRHAAAGGLGVRTAARVRPVLDARVHTALARSYGGLVHRIQPSLAWRAAPTAYEEGPIPDLDAFDRTTGVPDLHQVVAALDNEVHRAGRRVLRLRLAQGFDVASAAVAESLARLDLRLGRPLSLEALVAVDPVSPAVTWADVTVVTRWPRVGGAVRWIRLAPEGSRWLAPDLDALFDAGVPDTTLLGGAGRRIHAVDLSAWVRPVGPLTVRYGLRLDLAADDPWGGAQHAAGLAWQSGCDCWSGSVTAIWPPGQTVPEVLVTFALAGLGG